MIVTRFAPSPTGYLHFGNIRTALFNWLAARHGGGVMQLRLEDTDAARHQEEYATAIITDLNWLGLDWQGEHPDIPWRQSQRHSEYESLFSVLRKDDRVYPCFCSPEELAAARKAQIAAHKPPAYSGKCGRLATVTAAQRMAVGEAHAWRFRMPAGVIRFDDLVHGTLAFAAADIGDFVIRRADGGFTFLFVNAADDALCGVTHVLRGEDHTANTPRQLALLSALALPSPYYAHVALMIGADSRPLSKRSGLVALDDWRRRGFLSAAILNYLARVGHHYPVGDTAQVGDHLSSLVTLAAEFDFNALARAPAQHDEIRLRRWQKEAVLQLTAANFRDWASKGEERGEDANNNIAFYQAIRDNTLLPADADIWRGVIAANTLTYTAAAAAEIESAGGDFYQSARAVMAEAVNIETWAEFCSAVKNATGRKGKSLMLPLRAALTGCTDGPTMAALYPLITANKRDIRLIQAQKKALAKCGGTDH